ncbi:hypothetical protein ANN_15206 [Periplaneta americana]|uniref:Uncharacterized protein n=1 Tax=Periplaneta americana TaxID=6978 RepID=A0ABQ8SGE7_PERAM|nr:hypothetical protein ANN_15206 [Periplaneta americana]
MSRDQNIVRNANIKIGDLSFEEVEKFKYLGATVTNINDTREEIKLRINMGNACYYSVEKLLSSSLLSKNLKVRIYKTVILPVLLYGCETWTLILREEHTLRVFQNKVLRKIFRAKSDGIRGEWRKLHNAELHALYSSPDKIRNIKSRRLIWAEHVARMGGFKYAYRVLVGRPEGKRPLGRPRRRWEDNIKMDLREVGYDDRDWINLAQDRDRWRAYVRAAMNLRVFSGAVVFEVSIGDLWLPPIMPRRLYMCRGADMHFPLSIPLIGSGSDSSPLTSAYLLNLHIELPTLQVQLEEKKKNRLVSATSLSRPTNTKADTENDDWKKPDTEEEEEEDVIHKKRRQAK